MPPNPVPAMVTAVPAGPTVGVVPPIVGTTLNAVELVAVPPGARTVILPLVAAAGTWVVIVPESTVVTSGAGTLLNRTEVAPPIDAPWMVIASPAAPEAGSKLVTTGV